MASQPAATVPMNDLRRQTAGLRDELSEAIARVVASGSYVLGENVAAFERAFASYCGVAHCIGVASGTDALELGLRALQCGPGAEVVTVANAGMYATTAILTVGAQPVFADVDPTQMTMDPASLAGAISARTSAIVVTHLYGQLAAMDSLRAIAEPFGIPIVEDCAQAHGAERGGRKAGSFGTIACYSFYPTKNLGAFGDGGAVITDDAAVAERLRRLRQYGWRTKYESETYGRNSRLDELQAAVLLAKLPYLDGWNERRRRIVETYRASARGGGLILPFVSKEHAAHLCVARSEARAQVRALFLKRGIQTDIHYPTPDYRQQTLTRAGKVWSSELPETDAASLRVLTLPCFPEMTDDEIERVCNAINAI